MTHVNNVNKDPTVLDIKALYGAKTLAGTGAGKAFLSKLLVATSKCPRQTLVAFDLRKADLVTASFFRASFKAFRDFARSEADLFPIHICRNEATLEEVAAYADDVGDVFLFADLTEHHEIVDPFLVGRLDDKQERALRALAEVGEADAAALFSKYPEHPPLATSAAWSNRLAALASKGLVIERIEGRSKYFRPIREGIRYGL